MKKNTMILAIHGFTVLPIVVFMQFYEEYHIAYLLLSIILFLWFGYTLYKYLKHQSLSFYPPWFFLFLGFYLYALVGLGSTSVPQSFKTLDKTNNHVVFNFNKAQNIDKVCYYIGIDKNVNFTLEFIKNGEWKKFYTYKKSFPFSFRWKCLRKKIFTDKLKLQITKNSMMLNEVQFFHKKKMIPYTSKYTVLNDESYMPVDTSSYSSMYFDEIYHGRAAYEMIHNLPIYENVHPYLGKTMLIPGIKMFGMTPFGWRISNVFFAGLLIYIMYLFSLQLFRHRWFAFLAATLMTYSFMHFTQSRLAHIDTFGVMFVMLSYMFLYHFIAKEKLSALFYSGLFFGLASAVKWSAVFSASGFVFILLYVIFTKHSILKRYSITKLLLYGLYSYGVLAVIIYSLSFFDMYRQTGSIQSIINYNLNIFNYHTNLHASHPYSSSWWTWLFDWKPMGYYKEVKQGMISTINVFGNPSIFWMGLVAIPYLLYRLITKPSMDVAFIIFAFLGLYLPYVFIGRLMFIYHFYYALPFLILAIIYILKDSRWGRKLSIYYITIVIGLFMLFYPVISGHSVSIAYVDSYLKWFPQWWF